MDNRQIFTPATSPEKARPSAAAPEKRVPSPSSTASRAVLDYLRGAASRQPGYTQDSHASHTAFSDRHNQHIQSIRYPTLPRPELDAMISQPSPQHAPSVLRLYRRSGRHANTTKWASDPIMEILEMERIDIEQVAASGKDGEVLRDDVENYIDAREIREDGERSSPNSICRSNKNQKCDTRCPILITTLIVTPMAMMSRA